MSYRSLAAALALALVACGGDDDATDGTAVDAGPTSTGDELVDRIAALPGVASVDELETDISGYRYFSIGFDQPVDHEDPDGQRFVQYLTLIHRDEHAPFILGTTGYGNYYGDIPMEPTALLDGNQLIIEHRSFLPSRPEPTDWSFLRVVQGAADHHAIAESFHQIYDGAWISTGGSKGGMTSIYHRHLYPDDVDGTVAYVAPHNQAAGDLRYDGWFDEVLPADCLQRVRDAQVDFLNNRRAALVERATAQAEDDGVAYTRVAMGPAIESAIAGVEWAFFQYTGVSQCDEVPGPDSTDDEAWQWLSEVNGPEGLSDEQLDFFEPYVYQAYAELGYPSTPDDHLAGLFEFTDADYADAEPSALPEEFDPSAVDAAAEWVKEAAGRVLLVYGEYDPWTAGAFDLGGNAGVVRLDVPAGTHNVGILDLEAADQVAALQLLEEWTGVAPVLPALRARWFTMRPREPRPPLHAWQRARRAR